MWLILLILSLSCGAKADEKAVFGHEDRSKNFLDNWDFESDLTSSDWTVSKAKGTRVNDAYTGRWALKISDREGIEGAAYQTVDCKKYSISGDTSYYFSTFIRTLNDVSKTDYTEVRAYCRIEIPDGSKEVIHFGSLPFLRKDNVWKHIGGDFRIPRQGCTTVAFHLRVLNENVNYIIDTASMTEIPKYKDWKSSFTEKIKRNRMSDINIRIDIGSHQPSDTQAIITHVRHDFGFGTAIKAFQFNRDDLLNTNYRNFILKHFNWVVFENDLKWRPMEAIRGEISFAHVDKAITVLREHNFTIRSHAVFWDIEGSDPDWVQPLKGNVLKSEMWRRLKYLVGHYKGELDHYDVCNEYLQRHYYEDQANDLNLFEEELRLLHKLDPGAKLFTNDYQCVRNGMFTSAFASFGRTLQQKRLPIDGIGCQSHLRVLPIPIEVLEKRTQILGSAGLPVVMSEFSVHSKDEKVKAQALEEAYYVYFSEPSVAGVLFWGFLNDWRYIFTDDCFLFEPPNMKPTKAGQIFLDLIHKEWHTHENFPLKKQVTQSSFRGFHGLYNLTVYQKNDVIHHEQFYVSKDKTASIQVNLK